MFKAKQLSVKIPTQNLMRFYGTTSNGNTIPDCPICEESSWYVSLTKRTGRVSISCQNSYCGFWFHNIDNDENRHAYVNLWTHHDMLPQQLNLLELRLKKLISFSALEKALKWITLEGGKYWAMQRLLEA